MLSRRVGSGRDDGVDVLAFRLVVELLVLFSSWFSSRLTQSTNGSETAREWIAVGSVRATVVANRPPMCEP